MMVVKKFMVLKTQFDLISRRTSSGNMVGVLGSIWVFVCNYVFFVSGFISRYILIRFQADDHINFHPVVCLEHDHQFDAIREEEVCLDSPITTRNDYQNRAETEDSDQNRAETEDSDQNRVETQDSDQNRAETTFDQGRADDYRFVETVTAVNTDLYEYTSNRVINGYMEEPKSMSFTVKELYVDWGSSEFSDDQIPVKAAKDYDADHEKAVEPIECIKALENEEHEEPVIDQYPIEEFSTEKVLDTESELCGVEDDNCYVVSDSKQDPVSSRKDEYVGSLNYQFLIYRNVVPYDEGLEPQSSGFQYDVEDHRVNFEMEDDQLLDVSIPDGKAVVFSDQRDGYESSDDDYIELLEPEWRGYSQQLDQVEDSVEHKEELVQVETQDTSPLVQSAEEESGLQQAKSVLVSDAENDKSYEEHDDLIEQIKREIRNVRTGGLPTISEEDHSESTKMVENLKLKPLKIDEKFEYKDRVAEIQKVYKSYAEKMRKLDILNNQTMHAIGFLQLKDQVKPISFQKSSINPIMKSLLSQNLLRWRAQRRPTVDPMPKYVGDLHKDLELVYVGQVCLSWEILNWQPRKAQELQQFDNHHHYNAVATEFQLFQVILQRFIEDDPYQGPRVQHYVRNRCVLRSLLQVPAIRDDCRKDKKLEMGEEEEGFLILSEMLVKIIEESMQIYWKFLRSDERNAVLKSLQESQVEHKDLELLIDIRKDFSKKEKKLKDIQRSGNCVVKKFQKQHQDQDRLEHSLFVAQVELRLVLRVLNMSKLTTDQLVWCHEKLDNINFVQRKVLMEPSFLLFPC